MRKIKKKKKRLPKNFEDLIELNHIEEIKELYEEYDINARGGYSKESALGFYKISDELVLWLVEAGADINAKDEYQRTPLHSQARSRVGNVNLFIKLGADIEALDYSKETPLHIAANSFNVRTLNDLINQGANIYAENNEMLNPLASALKSCRNIDIVEMNKIAEMLIKAGTEITDEMKKTVKKIGENFEFHKENFNKESVPETVEALNNLYLIFDVEPVEARKIHDGVSLIKVMSKTWKEQYNELWNLLIPSQGPAKTVQGEVIRITGKISYEIINNGRMNWDKEFKKIAEELLEYFKKGKALSDNLLEECVTLVNEIIDGYGDEESQELCEMAVKWVLLNEKPIILEKVKYKR